MNGVPLLEVPHSEARQTLKQLYAICRLTVYREKTEDHAVIDQSEGTNILEDC